MIRNSLFILVTLLSVLGFLSHKRYYPFSDYYLFSFVRPSMKHYSLAFKDMNDKYVFLNSVDTQPLSRLHIHQAILSSKRHNTGFAWISFYSDKWKGQNRYKSIVACLATYDDSINENHIDEVLFEQTIP